MNDFGYIVVNARGHERFTDPQTGRCNICDQLTATECVCGRCLDLHPINDHELTVEEALRIAELPEFLDITGMDGR